MVKKLTIDILEEKLEDFFSDIVNGNLFLLIFKESADIDDYNKNLIKFDNENMPNDDFLFFLARYRNCK